MEDLTTSSILPVFHIKDNLNNEKKTTTIKKINLLLTLKQLVMSTKTIAGVEINVNEEGYMTEISQWSKEIGAEIAKEEGIDLTDKHYELIEFIRNKVSGGEGLTIRGIGKSGIVNAKEFYQLFPGAPLKKATKISGVPKPTSCI